MICFVIEV